MPENYDQIDLKASIFVAMPYFFSTQSAQRKVPMPFRKART